MALLLNVGDTVSRSYSYTQPSPLHPSLPEGTGERTGNLFDKTAEYVIGGTTYNYTISGLDPDKDYTCSTSFEGIDGVGTASLYFNGGISIENGVWSDKPRTFKPNANGEIVVYIRYKVDAGAPAIYDDVMAGTIWVMVNEGSTAIPYENFGYKIPISSANTTTPVYLGEVQTTRKIGKLVLTGNENWVSKGNPATFRYENSPILDDLNSVCYCSHFKNLPWAQVGTTNNSFVVWFTSAENTINIRCEDYSTVEDFKAFLSAQYQNGTPVTIWYVLAEPTTGIVNEPLRKIGDYADTVSGITIPTIIAKDTFDVETTLKPSEASLSYTGWHDATVKEWNGSQWNE